MSREIKFRGYSIELGKWIYGDLIQTKPNKVDGCFTSWIKERCILGLGVVSTPTSDFIKVVTESATQYTCVKDKDGKEIYEGDILLFASKSDSETFVREVKFEDGSFVVDVDDDCGMYLGGICTNENHEGSHTGYVMGNIYQNPELLQES